ncbi:GNAT family N-acetyltransferase [Micromonospora sp. CPCC 205561]|uniref:GNAT family N-acetyltransferase n=1 Tax=Micromonospora sp. CPCC 205561 TaxID=3122407 RepID=UPI002FF23D58
MTSEAGASPIRTKRLVLREVRTADLAVLERMWRDPVMRRHLGGPLTDEAVAARRAGDQTGGLMVTTSSGTAVGWCHLGRYRTGDVELSYVFLPEWWGRGYAREACAAAVGPAFDLFPDVARLVAVTQESNVRSVRLLEAIGMVRVDAFEEFGAGQAMYAIRRPGAERGAWAGGGGRGPSDQM